MVNNMLWFEKCDSTMDICHRFSSICDRELIIGSSVQIEGRGTKNRGWVSPYGNLYLSYLLYPKHRKIHTIHMIGTLSVLKFLEQKFGDHNISIKWPNDVMVDEKKICGVLQENVFKNSQLIYSVLGIGLNVNMQINSEIDVPHNSVQLITNKTEDIKNLAKDITCIFNEYYMSGISDVEIMNIWRNNIDTIGKKIKLILLDEEFISGKVKDIDLNGDLVLNLSNNKLITIKAGMVKEMKISK